MSDAAADVYDLGDRSPETLLEYYERLIPVVYVDRFPPGFCLTPSGWHLPTSIVTRNEISHRGKRTRPIGTLDVEFLSDEMIDKAKSGLNLQRSYPCGLKCPGCFSEDSTYADASRFLYTNDVFNVIDDARTIGLSSIKFLGPGELFQNPDLFRILDAAEARALPISVFTKGAELGNDELATYIYGRWGIRSAADLVERIAGYSCVRILLGFNSFDPLKQDIMVGSSGVTGHYEVSQSKFVRRGVERYTEKRNRALVNLVEAGFNDPVNEQKLSLIAAPVRLNQIDEIPDMYEWAARRNIPLVIAPTMESGPKALGLMRCDIKRDPAHIGLKAMFLAVYTRGLEQGITTMEAIESDGISAYMGTAPCNQVANGLYLRLDGRVQMCPGTSRQATVFGNVHEASIIDIWKGSSSYRMGATLNNWCTAKVNGMPYWIQEEVLHDLKRDHPQTAPERVKPYMTAV